MADTLEMDRNAIITQLVAEEIQGQLFHLMFKLKLKKLSHKKWKTRLIPVVFYQFSIKCVAMIFLCLLKDSDMDDILKKQRKIHCSTPEILGTKL